MAVLKNGIFGVISGKLGSIVYVNRKGVNYLRTKPSVHKKSNSTAQQAQRSKFAIMFKFLKPFAELLSIGFHQQAKSKTGYNAAMSYNLKNGFTESATDVKVDYSKILLTQGSLCIPHDPFLNMAAPSIIAFHWNYHPLSSGNPKPDDVALLIAFFESSQKVIFQITSTRREHQKALLTIPDDLHGQEAFCWLAFKSCVGSRFSNTVYLGSILV